MSPSGIDQSWGYADPRSAKAAGVEVVSMYLSHDPSKNASGPKIRAYHAQGIAVLLNWESDSGRALLGAVAGDEDALAAVNLVHDLYVAVGYRPKSKLAIPFSCDRDVNPSQYPIIDAYYSNTKRVLGAEFVNGVYGEADLIDHLAANGLTGMQWQTLAWSNGRTSPQADFYQSSINNTLGGASVDFDEVMHAEQCGAWWPPGHRYDTTTLKPTIPEKITMAINLTVARRAIVNALHGKGWFTKHGGEISKGGGVLHRMNVAEAELAEIKAELAAIKKAAGR